MKNTLYMVIPCYNEKEVLNETATRLKKIYSKLIKSNKIHKKSKIVFVNDGSKDTTWEIIKELHENDDVFSGINLSRNKGHQNALLAGLLTVKDYSDMVISMDADLQDDINAIEKMVDKYLEGYDIVYGVRSKRETDTFFKRFTAESYYKILNFIGGEVIYNHADYRLMSKQTIEELAKYKEVNLFLRGVVPMLGFSSTTVSYERNERLAGESKYPLKKMLSFALEGITSLSIKPIRIISGLGVLIFAVSILMLIYIIVRHQMGDTVTGWASVAVSVWAIGGLMLLSIGIVGEYIGKIYLETKQRPKFSIKEFINKTN
ncbi:MULTISPECIES: glycosyltransferase family 2 protein [Carnobacterium]|uniref:Glycosyltransferase family 2 protein n=1 Tax=Carnobacterium antarcticum TaxID=2126436 RepID=A0ABW4NLG3_9LACT|nr:MULTISPECIES: glycosyltransferase family 2 protein [unclassified Carnobacterium]ALV21568.1 Glycosyltransferase [Carnobacterium sp. CP1]QQP69583.1 glycosyltransferase [Carnobacterium sp. CS13]